MRIESPRPDAPRSRSAGAAARFEQIYAANYRAVLAYCMRRTSRVDAFDAAADVFAVAWRRLDVVPDGDDTLRWLYGVAYRVISSQWRRGRARRKVLDALRGRQPEPASGPETEVVRRAEYSQVLAAAARLSGEDREILRLAMWEELSHGEIAAALGLRVDAVRQRFHRAKKRLAHEYRRLGGTVPPSHDHEERI